MIQTAMRIRATCNSETMIDADSSLMSAASCSEAGTIHSGNASISPAIQLLGGGKKQEQWAHGHLM